MHVQCTPESTILRRAVIVTLLFLTTTVAQAEDGSFAQRRACRPDVFRLCNQFIPDRAAITNCLQRSKPRLSPDCRAVFERRLK
jgi:hypothetical protein